MLGSTGVDRCGPFVAPDLREGAEAGGGAETEVISDSPCSQNQPFVAGALKDYVAAWREEGAEEWVCSVLAQGYAIPFISAPPPLSKSLVALTAYTPGSEKLKVLDCEVKAMLAKQAIEVVRGDFTGFYNRLFVVTKANGGWRLVLDVSALNKFVLQTKFTMESPRSVLRSVRRGDWMFSIDLQDAYSTFIFQYTQNPANT